MHISSFMNSHKCIELAKRFSDKVPLTVKEMMTRVDDFVRSEEAYKNTELPKGEVQDYGRKNFPSRVDRARGFHVDRQKNDRRGDYRYKEPYSPYVPPR